MYKIEMTFEVIKHVSEYNSGIYYDWTCGDGCCSEPRALEMRVGDRFTVAIDPTDPTSRLELVGRDDPQEYIAPRDLVRFVREGKIMDAKIRDLFPNL